MNRFPTFVSFIVAATLLGCANPNDIIAPQYLDTEWTNRFFAREIAEPTNENLRLRYSLDWGYEFDLVNSLGEHKAVSSCAELKDAKASEFGAAKAFEHVALMAYLSECQTWLEMAKLGPSKYSYLSDFKLDETLPDNAPSALAFVISNESADRAKSLSTWNEADKIKQVKVTDKRTTEYYDATDGLQVVTIKAKGDYNADGLEDIIISKENSVLSGSYSSSHGYVLTRLSEGSQLKVLAEW
nr:ATPase [Vibrio diabolicus]